METEILKPIPISTSQLYWRIKADRVKNAVLQFFTRLPRTFLTLLLEVLIQLCAWTIAIIIGFALIVITVTSLAIDWAWKQIDKLRTLK
jgi:hypothetical protein